MSSEEHISIKVTIADRVYPLTVKMSEEADVRNAAQYINDKIRNYRDSFEVKNKEDLLAMCSLEVATELSRIQSGQWIRDEGISEKVNTIHRMLTE